MNKTDQKGIVAAGHRLTANTAADILRAGGSAIDAAIAALAMSCLCEPVLSSPGGGGFAMLRNGATGHATLMDFFPQTPIERRQGGNDGVHEIHANFGTATQAFHIGPATSATPGFLAGIEALHEKGATMGLADLFAPTVQAARQGITITPYQHYLSTVVEPILTASTAAANLYYPGGNMPKPGEIFNNPGMADAFEIMGHGGFFGSPVGEATIGEQKAKGNLTRKDLAEYEVAERHPLAVRSGTSTIHMNPLPAASGTLIAHSLAQLASPQPVDIARALLATGRARRHPNGDLGQLLETPLRQRGTTHISVIDAAGNACAVTVSNGEGNGELVGDFGFMLNNILGEEDVNPLGTEDWPLNTRLSSMMCPALIETEDGSIVALGSGGSNRIRSAIMQVIVRHCLQGKNLESAITAPRLHVEGEHLDFEDLFTHGERQKLCQTFSDHRAWHEPNMFFGGVHAVRMDVNGGFSGTGDARRDGVVIQVD